MDFNLNINPHRNPRCRQSFQYRACNTNDNDKPLLGNVPLIYCFQGRMVIMSQNSSVIFTFLDKIHVMEELLPLMDEMDPSSGGTGQSTKSLHSTAMKTSQEMELETVSSREELGYELSPSEQKSDSDSEIEIQGTRDYVQYRAFRTFPWARNSQSSFRTH